MKLYAMNTLLCEPYELKNQKSNSLFLTPDNTVRTAKIISSPRDEVRYTEDMIVVCDKEDVKEYMIDGKKYFAINPYDVFAIIKEDE
jgi:hypothetical protein